MFRENPDSLFKCLSIRQLYLVSLEVFPPGDAVFPANSLGPFPYPLRMNPEMPLREIADIRSDDFLPQHPVYKRLAFSVPYYGKNL